MTKHLSSLLQNSAKAKTKAGGRLVGDSERLPLGRFYRLNKPMQQAENTEHLKRLPEQFPHPLAIEWGEDDFGLYQMVELFGVEHVFRWIPPGLFQLGSPKNEEGRFERETLHWVTLTEGFWLGETVISQQQWKAVMDENRSETAEDNLPQVRISWDDCARFIEAINSEHKGLGARFPTEAEWEYACRAGSNTTVCWGEKLDLSNANFLGTWDFGVNREGGALQKICPVKSYLPNAWGLYQMHGNVWEWCWDYFSDYPAGNSENPEGPEEETVSEDYKLNGRAVRVLRGGSWGSRGRNLRSAYRGRNRPDERNNYIGFRLALGRELGRGGAANKKAEPQALRSSE
ncbi:formylglycine-generating enzyme family protein [Teredinibacter turnerae]|uniref:formylglycine-generating enzyme family protein n=1 Tax=Teredinibacter turnerae TaxID=2426 RepID=UPI000697E246|nr:formylglycine-generating enzyme family protein [Teredinibacter turnerae]